MEVLSPKQFDWQDSSFPHRFRMERDTQSLDSISMMSTSDVSGFLGEKDDDEKVSEFAPTLSYGRITLVAHLSLRS